VFVAVRRISGKLGGGTDIRGPAALGLVASLVGLATALTNPFLPVFVTSELGASQAGLGLFLGGSALAALVVTTAVGRLSDGGVGRVRLIALGGVAGAACYGTYAVTRAYWPLLLVAASLGAAASTLVPQVFARARELADAAGHRRVPIAIGALRTCFSVAWVLGPPLAAGLISVAGFRGLFAAVCVTYGAVAALAMVALRGPASRQSPRMDGGRDGWPRRDIVATTAAFVAFQTASALGVVALPLFLLRDLHASTAAVGLMFGLAAGLEIPLMLAAGAVALRVGTAQVVRAGVLAGALYYAAVWLASSTWEVAVAQVLQAVFVAGMMGMGIALFQDLMPGRPGRATSLYANTSRVSAVATGALVAAAQAVGYRGSFAIGAGLCCIGLVLLALGRRPVAQATPEAA
jgi:SET family sugar efflux transporter-like MFS transporter